MTDSVNGSRNHSGLIPGGKGMEGRGREERHSSSIRNWRQSPAAWMAADAAAIGGGC